MDKIITYFLWFILYWILVMKRLLSEVFLGASAVLSFESDLKEERFLMDENGQIRQIIPSREDSLDRLMDDNAEQFANRNESVEDMVLRRISIERLYKALDTLTEKERKLIEALFFYSLDFEVTPHQLRHTYITNLIHASVDPKTVQYLAGHESSRITMDIYAKVKYNRPDEMVKALGGAFAQWDAGTV